jgi:small GTP-binding protein
MRLRRKVCLLGAKGVGKTSLVRRLVEDRFEDDEAESTALSIFRRTLELDDVSLEMVLWDPAHSESSEQFHRSFISGASGLVFVVDSARPSTLDQLLQAQVAERGFIGLRPAILILNKSDLHDDFALSAAQLRTAESVNWHIVRASAKTGENVEQAFTTLAERMLGARKATA